MLDILNDYFKSMNDAYTKMFPLHILYISAHKRQYIVGNQVVIENEKLMNYPDEIPTHEITLLEGTLTDSKHSMTVRNLSTNEVLKIYL